MISVKPAARSNDTAVTRGDYAADMENALPALVAYFGFGLLVALWMPVMLVLWVITAPFDRNRRLVGFGLRKVAVLVGACYPRWRMRLEEAARAPRGVPFVAVANHESILDVLLIPRVPWEMKWMAKRSLFKLPFIGWMLRLAGDIPVDRRDRDSGARALLRARRYLERGMPVMLFPEGTRSRSPDGRLLPFKPGAFKLALETGAPILPIAVHGTAGGMPVGSPWIRPTDAVARVLDPIPVAGLTEADLPTLVEEVRARLQRARDELALRHAEGDPQTKRPDTPESAEPLGGQSTTV